MGAVKKLLGSVLAVMAKCPKRVRKWLAIIFVAVVAIGVYRWNTVAAIVALATLHLILLVTVFSDKPSLKPAKLSGVGLLAPRLCYPLGLVLGGVAAIGSSNGPVKFVAIVVLAGLHAVAVAAALTIAAHTMKGWPTLTLPQLLASGAIAACAIALAIIVDVRHAHQAFGIGGGAYIFWVALVIVVVNAVTLNYLSPRTQRAQAPSVAAVVSYTSLSGGAVALILTLVVMAYWRNNEPVGGPPLYKLPEVPAIIGDYVALGDSYSAGEGLHPFEAFTDSDHGHLGDGCHRSQSAYSQLLRFAPPTPAKRFVACSGALAHDVFHTNTITYGDGQTLVVPAQVRDGQHPEVGLVTITVGGNDVVFSKVVTHCFRQTNCLHVQFHKPNDIPDRDLLLPPDQPLESWATAAIGTVKDKVDDLYPALQTAYPNARIIVIGYPYLFPDRHAPFLNLTDCQTILRRFDHTERGEIRKLQDLLNQTLHDSAVAAGIEFISPAAGWSGHEPCGTGGEQYTNSIKPFLVSPLTGLTPGDGGTFHPNVAGQREFARLLTCYLIANPQAPTATIGEDPLGSRTNPIPDCAAA